jgi:hypothetical protein
MTIVKIDVDPDEFFEAHDGPGILGPNRSDPGWVVYLPGQAPIICDTFKEAAATMRESTEAPRKRK